jgi:PIN domain nuclease of toxin-antitoxin system
MKLLLDTHTFIWWDSEPAKLPAKTLALCQEHTNTVIVSVVSVWEMQIKLQLGKLKLNLPLAEVVENQRQTNNIAILPVLLAHVLALENLPAPHKDPFDRPLIAQANVESALLVSHDPIFAKYPVQLIWQ